MLFWQDSWSRVLEDTACPLKHVQFHLKVKWAIEPAKKNFQTYHLDFGLWIEWVLTPKGKGASIHGVNLQKSSTWSKPSKAGDGQRYAGPFPEFSNRCAQEWLQMGLRQDDWHTLQPKSSNQKCQFIDSFNWMCIHMYVINSNTYSNCYFWSLTTY